MTLEETANWISGGDAAQQVRGRPVTLWLDCVAMNDQARGTPGYVALTEDRARKIQTAARRAMKEVFDMTDEALETRAFQVLYPFMAIDRELCAKSRAVVLQFITESGEPMGEVYRQIQRAIAADGIAPWTPDKPKAAKPKGK